MFCLLPDMCILYVVVFLMLGHYQKYTPKPPNIAELKTALLSIWNDLPQEFTDKAIPSKELDFDRMLLQLVHILNTQFKHRDGS